MSPAQTKPLPHHIRGYVWWARSGTGPFGIVLTAEDVKAIHLLEPYTDYPEVDHLHLEPSGVVPAHNQLGHLHYAYYPGIREGSAVVLNTETDWLAYWKRQHERRQRWIQSKLDEGVPRRFLLG